jgi:hypothetical protein
MIFGCTIFLLTSSWNLVISLNDAGCSIDPSSANLCVLLTAVAWFINTEDTWSHRASIAGLVKLWADRDSVEGLVDGVRVIGVAARKTFDIEAGPLLQTLNIFNSNDIKPN